MANTKYGFIRDGFLKWTRLYELAKQENLENDVWEFLSGKADTFAEWHWLYDHSFTKKGRITALSEMKHCFWDMIDIDYDQEKLIEISHLIAENDKETSEGEKISLSEFDELCFELLTMYNSESYHCDIAACIVLIGMKITDSYVIANEIFVKLPDANERLANKRKEFGHLLGIISWEYNPSFFN